MNIEIIPGIIKDTWGEVESRLKVFAGKVEWVHLDISDGIFAPHKTWNNAEDLTSSSLSIKIEAHLMIASPWEALTQWVKIDLISRIIVHVEVIEDYFDAIKNAVNNSRKELVIAINPETNEQLIEPFIENIDGIMIMGVNPGYSGAEFEPVALRKISSLRAKYPNVTIEIDGGVSSERIAELVKAGANRLVSTSFIESFKDPREGIEQLRRVIENR